MQKRAVFDGNQAGAMSLKSVKINCRQATADDESSKKRKAVKKLTPVGVVGRLALGVLTVELVVLLLLGGVIGLRQSGANSLRKGVDSSGPSLDSGLEEDDPASNWQEGWVRHDGKVYEYNDDILTFLFLGIDKMEKVSPNPDLVSGGQSDAIFLLVVDTAAKDMCLVGVNRDTIVDIRMVGIGDDGEDIIFPAQLTVQHGFGDGMEGSCQMTEEAVSKLFYGLPIHGYVSFNMGGIAELNDAIGGVELEILEDLPKVHKNWTKGTQVKLEGMDAFWYVKYRDTTIFESARGRLARQKQYLGLFAKQAIAATKKDITLPVTLYGTLKDYIVTDISVDEMTYLASELVNYQFDIDEIYTMEGTTIRAEKFEEFYPDKDALRDLIIKVFYREVSRY